MKAREVLGGLEGMYAGTLRRSELAAECDVTEEDIVSALRCIGTAYDPAAPDDYLFLQRLGAYPASTVIAFAGGGALRYENNTYWPHVLELARVKDTQQAQKAMAGVFHRAVARLSLRTFPHLPRTNIGPILMHAGIPVSCVGDFVGLLVDRLNAAPGLTADDFMAWALDPRVNGRLNSLQVPVRHFLRYGGELAVDIVDRSVEFLGFSRLRPAEVADLSSDTTGLPGLMLAEMKRLILMGAFAFSVAPGRQRDRAEVPHLAYHVWRGTIELRLPAVDTEDGLILWTVAADGRQQTVVAESEWPGERLTPEKAEPLVEPVRRVLVTNDRNDNRVELAVAIPEDPLLLFDASTGRHIPLGATVPAGEVWAIHPAAEQLIDEQDNPISADAQGALLPGWRGWCAQRIDTSHLQSITATVRGHVPKDSRRLVRRSTLPQIMPGPAIPHIRTIRGDRIYSSLPAVELPGGTVNDPWTIAVSANGGVESNFEVLGRTDLAELGTWTGEVTVVATAGLGRRTRRTVTVVPGLIVMATVTSRTLVPGGLEQARVAIRCLNGSEDLVVDLTRSDWHQKVEINCGQVSMSAIVEIPSMAVAVDVGGVPGVWTNTPAILSTDELVDTVLRVRLPGVSTPIEAVLEGDDGSTQTISSQVIGDVHRIRVSALSGTARQAQRSTLFLPWLNERLRLLGIKPPVLATGAVWSASRLFLQDLVFNPDLRAGIYQESAPWEPVVVSAIDKASRVLLPDGFTEEGSLRVLLLEDDGWATVEWPEYPVAGSFLSVRRSGFPRGENSYLNQLSAVLAEELEGLDRAVVLEEPSALAMAVLRADPGRRSSWVIRKAINSAGLDGVLALAESGLSSGVMVPVMVQSGVMEQAWQMSLSQSQLDGLWTRLPVAAAIVTCSDVLTGESLSEETEASLREVAGAECAVILRRQGNLSEAVGTFGPDARLLSRLSAEQLDDAWSSVGVVPAGWLDADGRIAEAKKLFDHRSDLTEVAKTALKLLGGTGKALKLSGWSTLVEQYQARLEVGVGAADWQYLPAASFVFAALARLTAQGCGPQFAMSQPVRNCWTEIARAAPTFVCMDLVLADALIVGELNRGRTHG